MWFVLRILHSMRNSNDKSYVEKVMAFWSAEFSENIIFSDCSWEKCQNFFSHDFDSKFSGKMQNYIKRKVARLWVFLWPGFIFQTAQKSSRWDYKEQRSKFLCICFEALGRVRKLVGDFKEDENLKNALFGINLVKVISWHRTFAFVPTSGFKSW